MTDIAFEKLQQAKSIIGSITTADLACMKEAETIVSALKAVNYAIKTASPKVGGEGKHDN